ncbi:hypothetical protein [Streptacidiphilus sp. EB103A]|uniref:hypothetical protein n=1 Tax=Streptacidiphilus sp. EB103A TaxID=3156275 RepID=UPI0035140783
MASSLLGNYALTSQSRKQCVRTFGYPLMRLVAVVECGTRALMRAAFGPDRFGELSRRLLGVRAGRFMVRGLTSP